MCDTMRKTRSKRKLELESTDENKIASSLSPVLTAKVTRSSSPSFKRQHLTTITNKDWNIDFESVNKAKKKEISRRSEKKLEKVSLDESLLLPVYASKVTRNSSDRAKRYNLKSNQDLINNPEPVKKTNKKKNSGKMRTLAKDEIDAQTGETIEGKRKSSDVHMQEEDAPKKFKENEPEILEDTSNLATAIITKDVNTINITNLETIKNTTNQEKNVEVKCTDNSKSNEAPEGMEVDKSITAKQTINNEDTEDSQSISNKVINENNDSKQLRKSIDSPNIETPTTAAEQPKAVNNETTIELNKLIEEACEHSNSSNVDSDMQPDTSNAAKNDNLNDANTEKNEQINSPSNETKEKPNISNTEENELLNNSNTEVNEQINSFNAENDVQSNVNHIDEQPSTSKEAMAQLTTQFKSLRRQRSNSSLAASNNDKDTINNDEVHTKTALRGSSIRLPDKLLSVISNLYLNAAERLKLDFPPRCAEDLEYCHQHHYRAPLPSPPNHTQANNLRCALQQQRYMSFVSWSLDMCHRGEFPGDGIFTKIIELVLSFNSKSSTKSVNNNYLGLFFNKSIELFYVIVRKFPPCWLTLRQFYVNFFQTPIDASKISKKNEPTLKSNNVLEILLDLLEATLEKCTEEDLQKDGETFEIKPKTTTPAEATASTTNPDEITAEVPVQQTESQDMGDSIANSECLNIWDWEEHENRMQTFEALRTPSVQLERLFIALELLLHILESDFVMWILHHHKKAKEWIFCENQSPLIVLVLALTKYSRSTGVVKHLFKLFAISANKRAKSRHLKILERYISLTVVASNVADMEYSAIGVRYPNLGTETKSLIHEFFKTFKARNTSLVSSYVNTIEILRIPYVRTEFIDYFLQLFYFPRNEEMSPKKIAYDISKKRYMKYKPQIELSTSDEDLSREQYLQLLLAALEAYCDWHGAVNFFHFMTKDKPLYNFRAVTDSVHRWPTKGSGLLMLNRMCKDIAKLEREIRMAVRMSKPKVDLPIADICIDQDVVLKYRTDLKFIVILVSIIAKHSEEVTDVDFTAWKKFLENFT